jgi:DNA-binding transcriptional MerR regulator
VKTVMSRIYTLEAYMKTYYSLNEVARLAGTLPHRISYAITNRHLPEPEERLNNHRLFTEADVKRIKKYFAKKRAEAKQEAKG